jgi:TonB family protein
MKKNAAIFWGMLVFFAPLALGAENSGLDSSSGTGVQRNPFTVTFRPGTELLSKPGSVFPGDDGPGGGLSLPVLDAMAKPITYPGWARRKGLEGLLVVALEILENGSVGRWKIMRSTGEEALDQAAEKAFLTWKFQPSIKNGRPVKTCIQVPIRFELKKE